QRGQGKEIMGGTPDGTWQGAKNRSDVTLLDLEVFGVYYGDFIPAMRAITAFVIVAELLPQDLHLLLPRRRPPGAPSVSASASRMTRIAARMPVPSRNRLVGQCLVDEFTAARGLGPPPMAIRASLAHPIPDHAPQHESDNQCGKTQGDNHVPRRVTRLHAGTG